MDGQALRDWREARGLTLVQLGKLLGLDWRTVQRRETGRIQITREMELALAELARKHKPKP